jgi:hypothetical protein
VAAGLVARAGAGAAQPAGGGDDHLAGGDHAIAFAIPWPNHEHDVAFGYVARRLAAQRLVLAWIEFRTFGRQPLHVVRRQQRAQIALDQQQPLAPVRIQVFGRGIRERALEIVEDRQHAQNVTNTGVLGLPGAFLRRAAVLTKSA